MTKHLALFALAAAALSACEENRGITNPAAMAVEASRQRSAPRNSGTAGPVPVPSTRSLIRLLATA